MLIRKVPGAAASRAARVLDNALSQYMRADSGFGLGAGDPFYIVVRARRTNTFSFSTVASLGVSGGSTNNSHWIYAQASSTEAAFVTINSSGGFERADSTGTRWSVDGLYHSLIGEQASTASRRLITDGVAFTNSGTAAISTAPNVFFVGCSPDLATIAGLDTAHVAIFRGTASDDLIAKHVRGAHPMSLPGHLLECWEMDRVGPLRGLVRGTMLNPVNGGSLIAGPVTQQGAPTLRRFFFGPVAGAGGSATVRLLARASSLGNGVR